MFSYALRQIQPRVGKPESRAFPRNCRRWFVGILYLLKKRFCGETITSYTRTAFGNDPLSFSIRARRTRDPVSRGKNEADPRVGYHCYVIFCSQTARQLVFCLSIFIFAVTSVYYCWYLLLCLRMRMLVTVYLLMCPRVKCFCPVSRSNGRVRMA